MDRSERIQLIELILIAGFFASLAYHYEIVADRALGFPWSTFLWDPVQQFTDLTNFTLSNNYPYDRLNSGCAYPPFFLAFINLVIKPLGRYAVPVYIGSAFAGSFALVKHYMSGQNWYETTRRCTTYTVFSLPFLFALDRGNLEIWQYFATVAFFYFLASNQKLATSSFLAMALNFKPFAMMYLPILVSRRAWKEIFLTVGIASVLMVLGTLYFHRTLPETIADYRCAASNCSDQQMVHDRGLGWSDDLFSLVKLTAAYTVQPFTTELTRHLLSWYGRVTTVLTLLIAAYVIFIDRALWRQALLCTIATILLPPLSGDYRLLELMAPLFLFVNNGQKSRMDFAFCALFALILIPKGYIHFEPGFVADSVVVNTLLLSALALLTIVQGFRHRSRTDADRDALAPFGGLTIVDGNPETAINAV